MAPARRTKPPARRRRPLVTWLGLRPRLQTAAFSVHLTETEFRAIRALIRADSNGVASNAAAALARLIDEGLSDALPEGSE